MEKIPPDIVEGLMLQERYGLVTSEASDAHALRHFLTALREVMDDHEIFFARKDGGILWHPFFAELLR